MLVKAARFEPRSNPNGSTGPAHSAIERVPAVIEQNAAAGHRWIDAPVRNSVRAYSDRRLRSQRPPADGLDGADCARVDQIRYLAADRRFEPVMHRVQDTSRARGGPCHTLCLRDLRDKRLFAEHMKAGVERPLDERRMVARRRTDVDKIELFAGQEIVDGFIPPAVGTGAEKGLAT